MTLRVADNLIARRPLEKQEDASRWGEDRQRRIRDSTTASHWSERETSKKLRLEGRAGKPNVRALCPWPLTPEPNSRPRRAVGFVRLVLAGFRCWGRPVRRRRPGRWLVRGRSARDRQEGRRGSGLGDGLPQLTSPRRFSSWILRRQSGDSRNARRLAGNARSRRRLGRHDFSFHAFLARNGPRRRLGRHCGSLHRLLPRDQPRSRLRRGRCPLH